MIEAAACPSPNFGEREGRVVDILVLHYTGMRDEASAIERLCDPQAQVSSHYLVGEDGRIVAMVGEDKRAWHAGVSGWRGHTDINARSIGIEIVNGGHDHGLPDFPDVQIEAVIALCRDILSRHPIPPRNVVAHSDVAPSRKQDPGEKFPWARLAASGVGLWVEADRAAGNDAAGSLPAKLTAYGYPAVGEDASRARLACVVSAFQRHFRPARVDGIADAETVAILDALLAATGDGPA